jgi:hypothetical protein
MQWVGRHHAAADFMQEIDSQFFCENQAFVHVCTLLMCTRAVKRKVSFSPNNFENT